ncbi:MAG: tetratricopeptide repeat protein [Verrucomicrobia bacterium]|nr:MAG: tetratricopeptide repeat protein [Verrucomicrobiota bacterium]
MIKTISKLAQAAKSWSAKHPLLTIGVFLLASLGPFINKAVHIDDPLFVWSAEWIAKHPADFYGFDVNWYGSTEPMALTNCNPPATSYLLAGVASLLGWREIVLHGVMLLVAFVAAAGIFQLARLWCERPLLATIVAMVTPVFLMSATTLMCDVPMLAVWVWAVVLWERALAGGGVGRFAAAGILAGLAVLTKYNALAFLPLLLILGALRKRRAGWWLLWLAVPMITILAYQSATARLYGHGLISVASNYAAETRFLLEGSVKKAILGLVFAGGSLLPVLFFAPSLWRRRMWLPGVALVFGLSLVVLWWSGLGAGSTLEVQLQMALLLAGGLHLLVLAAVEWWRRRDVVTFVIAAWIFGGFVFAAVLNWTVSARSLLPIVPPVAILLVRALARENFAAVELRRLSWPLVASMVAALCIAVADFQLAGSARAAARRIMARYQPAASRVWFEGHCAFQFYMEKLGAHPVDFALATLQPGEILVVPSNNSNLTAPPPDAVELLETQRFAASTWLSTVQGDLGAGFYGAGGRVPFLIGEIPPEEYYVFKVVRPLQFSSTSVATNADDETRDWPTLEAKYAAVLRASPNNAGAHARLASVLDRQGKTAEAIRHYRKTLRLAPDQPDALNNLAWHLAADADPLVRDGAEAVKLAERACELTGRRKAMLVGTLAAAYAEAGKFDDAIAAAQTACALAEAAGEAPLAQKNRELLELYRAHQPYHESAERLVPVAR